MYRGRRRQAWRAGGPRLAGAHGVVRPEEAEEEEKEEEKEEEEEEDDDDDDDEEEDDEEDDDCRSFKDIIRGAYHRYD